MTCINCRQGIRWCDLALRWFHIGNLTAFCTGLFGSRAEPADLELA
jgi:hypothetical protein